jgi:hypothetical protein
MRDHQAELDQAARERIQHHFNALRGLMESSFALREEMALRETAIRDTFAATGEVTRYDVELILEGAHWFYELEVLLYSLWLTYRDYLPYGSEPDPYAPTRAATLLSTDTRIKGGLLALAAAMIRMDNAARVIDIINDDLALTHLLNRGDATRGIPPESYDRMVGGFYDPDTRALLQIHLRSVAKNRERLSKMAVRDGQLSFLLAVIRESPTAGTLVEEWGTGRQWRFFLHTTGRSLAGVASPGVEVYARVLYNEEAKAGLWKGPPLHTVPGMAESIYDTLQPMDVLFLRDDDRRGATGGFTHAVVYLGERRELDQLGVADHAAFAFYGTALRRGRVFMEHTSQGLRLYTLDEILKSHDVAVVRYGPARVDPGAVDPLADDEPGPETDADAPPSTRAPDSVNDGGISDDGALLADDGGMPSSSDGGPIPPSSPSPEPAPMALPSEAEPGELDRALNALSDAAFLAPTVLSDGDRTARLLIHLFGERRLGVTRRPSETLIPLGRVIRATFDVENTSNVTIPFATLDGEIAGPNDRPGAVEKLGKRRGDLSW